MRIKKVNQTLRSTLQSPTPDYNRDYNCSVPAIIITIMNDKYTIIDIVVDAKTNSWLDILQCVLDYNILIEFYWSGRGRSGRVGR
jgi:hypothetical protein